MIQYYNIFFQILSQTQTEESPLFFYEINIKNLESIKNYYQINSLCFAAIHQLGNEYYMNKELIDNCNDIANKFNKNEWYQIALSNFYK